MRQKRLTLAYLTNVLFLYMEIDHISQYPLQIGDYNNGVTVNEACAQVTYFPPWANP